LSRCRLRFARAYADICRVDDGLEIVVGTQSTGQDHAAATVAHAARMLGLAPESVVVRQGDSDALGQGGGTGGSKSLLTNSERAWVAHVVPSALDPAVGGLDVRDAELVDVAVEGIGVALTRAQDLPGPGSAES
jgi:CO/xanthine dehydrogenase Mo-binding subunit